MISQEEISKALDEAGIDFDDKIVQAASIIHVLLEMHNPKLILKIIKGGEYETLIHHFSAMVLSFMVLMGISVDDIRKIEAHLRDVCDRAKSKA